MGVSLVAACPAAGSGLTENMQLRTTRPTSTSLSPTYPWGSTTFENTSRSSFTRPIVLHLQIHSRATQKRLVSSFYFSVRSRFLLVLPRGSRHNAMCSLRVALFVILESSARNRLGRIGGTITVTGSASSSHRTCRRPYTMRARPRPLWRSLLPWSKVGPCLAALPPVLASTRRLGTRRTCATKKDRVQCAPHPTTTRTRTTAIISPDKIRD